MLVTLQKCYKKTYVAMLCNSKYRIMVTPLDFNKLTHKNLFLAQQAWNIPCVKADLKSKIILLKTVHEHPSWISRQISGCSSTKGINNTTISYMFCVTYLVFVKKWNRYLSLWTKEKLRRCKSTFSGFGVLEAACWPLVPKFPGLHTAEAVGFLGQKKPQHTFLWRERKAVGPMSWL
jgi:hypothetical protein